MASQLKFWFADVITLLFSMLASDNMLPTSSLRLHQPYWSPDYSTLTPFSTGQPLIFNYSLLWCFNAHSSPGLNLPDHCHSCTDILFGPTRAQSPWLMTALLSATSQLNVIITITCTIPYLLLLTPASFKLLTPLHSSATLATLARLQLRLRPGCHSPTPSTQLYSALLHLSDRWFFSSMTVCPTPLLWSTVPSAANLLRLVPAPPHHHHLWCLLVAYSTASTYLLLSIIPTLPPSFGSSLSCFTFKASLCSSSAFLLQPAAPSLLLWIGCGWVVGVMVLGGRGRPPS